jgi:hypothetical protein
MCSSLDIRFPCLYVADVSGFAPALSSQTNATISRRRDCRGRWDTSRFPKRDQAAASEITAGKAAKRRLIACVNERDLVLGQV